MFRQMKVTLSCLLLSLWLMTSLGVVLAGDAENLRMSADLLTRQLMMQINLRHERARATLNSGVKNIRQTTAGSMAYFSEAHSGKSAAAIYNRADNPRELGMGEIEAVMNGITFRTKHMTYSLQMPASDKTDGKLVDIPFPDVPANVLKQTTVDGQIAEMQKCFKAWRNQDSSNCDYKKHFKAVLCYLEGAWTTDSGRSWDTMHQQAYFSAMTGMKDVNENYQYLPTSIMSPYTDVSNIKHGQWTYRMVCHPLKYNLPLNRFIPIDDLQVRMPYKMTKDEYVKSNAARFAIHPADNPNLPYVPHHHRYSYLDLLMSQIPGRENYGAKLTDDTCDSETLDMKRGTPLNAAYYHRWFLRKNPGKKGTNVAHRGYNDKNIFMAMTTQSKVAGMQAQCGSYTKTLRFTYAIPMEIVYMTPLSKWNPHGIKNGHYRLPYKFCTGGEVNRLRADTAKDKVTVKAANGQNVDVRGSGHRIFLCDIPGVGALRQRFPIFGTSEEGTYPYKELAALKRVVFSPSKYAPLFD